MSAQEELEKLGKEIETEAAKALSETARYEINPLRLLEWRNRLAAIREGLGRAQGEAVASSPDDIRAEGWAVAVHNDYRLGGVAHTFWLFTKGGLAIKGEGTSDAFALNEIREQIGIPLPAIPPADSAQVLVEALEKIATEPQSCGNCNRWFNDDKYPCHSCCTGQRDRGFADYWIPKPHIQTAREALAAHKSEAKG